MTTGTHVYIVDDDRDTLRSVEALLSQHGYETICFNSAESFLEQASLDDPGCLVTDVQMPTMDGIELQKKLQEIDSVLSVVVVTGVADVPMAVDMMRRGAVDLLEKPYDHIDLLAAVDKGVTASKKRAEERQLRLVVQENLETLSEEERTVLQLMLVDKPNKTIASGIRKGLRTVDRRRQSVLEKMGVRSVPELATLLASAGIVIQ